MLGAFGIFNKKKQGIKEKFVKPGKKKDCTNSRLFVIIKRSCQYSLLFSQAMRKIAMLVGIFGYSDKLADRNSCYAGIFLETKRPHYGDKCVLQKENYDIIGISCQMKVITYKISYYRKKEIDQ